MRRAIAAHRRGAWPQQAALDTVTLAYDDRHRRRIRLIAGSGERYLLDLPRAHHLVDGDGLELEGGGYIRVRAAAEPVFEITAREPADLLRIAWHLGNRHLPVQIAEMVTGLGGRIAELEAPFDPEGGAYFAGGHQHGDG